MRTLILIIFFLLCFLLSEDSSASCERLYRQVSRLQTSKRVAEESEKPIVLETPVPLDSISELWAVSYPEGKKAGALWHLRLRPEANEIVKMDGKKYVPLQTEWDQKTQEVFAYFGRKTGFDSKIGHYWVTRESPELYETLRRRWNQENKSEPSKLLHLKLRTTGPDNQIKMAELRSERKPVVGVGSPFEELIYIPTNEAVPNLDSKALKRHPVSKRVIQVSSLAAHDWREIDSAIWISPEVASEMQHNSALWLEIHSILKKKQKLAVDPAAREMSQKFRDHAKYADKSDTEAKWGAKGFTTTGAYWWRLAEIEIYKAQRTFHSYNHLLSLLLRRPKGIKLNDQIDEYGPIHQREVDLHRRGLGQASGADLRNPSPLVELTFNDAKDVSPLTLETAIGRLTNGERERLMKFAEAVPDKEVKALIHHYLEKHPMLNQKKIEAITNNQRDRFEGN